MDLRALSIVSGRRCWILCMDALVLAADGSILDALSIAAKVLLTLITPPRKWLCIIHWRPCCTLTLHEADSALSKAVYITGFMH